MCQLVHKDRLWSQVKHGMTKVKRFHCDRNDDITTLFFLILHLLCLFVCLFVCLMVFNATFNNVSVISWGQFLLVEETGGPEENHRPVASH